jgi:hypothetical protein
MLSVDRMGLPAAELGQVIAARCAQSGKVAKTVIYRATDDESWPFALVEMSSAAEVSSLASAFGDAMSGGTVLIQLQQEVRVPAFLRRAAAFA